MLQSFAGCSSDFLSIRRPIKQTLNDVSYREFTNVFCLTCSKVRAMIYWSKLEDSLIGDELSGARWPHRREAVRMNKPLTF